jgi:hypothetical protein
MRALVVILALVASSAALAAPLGLRMTTNATTVREGDSFQLDVVLTVDGQDAVDEFDLPDLTDFSVMQESESQGASIHIVGGRRRVVVEHRRSFVLKATEAGTKQIGEARARLDGSTARAAPITIRVVATKPTPTTTPAPPTADAVPVPAEEADSASTSTLPEPGARFGDELPRIFAELRADKRRAFVGEQITLLGEVYSQVPLGQYPRVPGQKPPGFVCLPLDDGTRLQASQRVLKGRSYYVYPVSRDAIFTTKVGTVTLAPLELEVTPAGSFFSRSQDVRLKSAPVVLEIMPLPDPVPPDFLPENVGRLELRASVRPTAVKPGEPFTLAVEAVGWGNPDAFVLPRWDGDGDARLFPPTTKRERRDRDGLVAGRVLEETLVQAQRPGRITIPALSMTVFDPGEGRFVTKQTGPVSVVVGGAAAAGAAPPATTSKRQRIGQGARPLALDVEPRGHAAFAFAPAVGGVIFGLGVIVGVVGRLRRRRQESAAGQQARRRAERAAAAAAARDAVDVAAAHRLLLDGLAERCGSDVRACEAAGLPDLLVQRGLGAHLAGRVARAILAGEAARFAPGGQKAEAVAELLACLMLVDGRDGDAGRSA